MGARAQVKIKGHSDTCVYLYTHWGAGELVGVVRKALALDTRWDDDEYLARIIFCTMVSSDTEGTTGFGIGTGEHGDIELLITVDTVNQKVMVHRPYSEMPVVEYTFTEFSVLEGDDV